MTTVTPPRARPTREQLWQIVEEYAINAYRMQAGRNIRSVGLALLPNHKHPYAKLLGSPVADFFPRALTVLAHATLEATIRNILKLMHPTRDAAWLERRWSASNISRIYEDLALSGVTLKWENSAFQTRIEGEIDALAARRNRIAHHADLPMSAESDLSLASSVLSWCHAVVIFEAMVMMTALPELQFEAHGDLLATVMQVQSDWIAFAAQVDPAAPEISVSL